MLAVVVSRADEASERIGEQLLELIEWNEFDDDRRSDEDGGGRYYRAAGIELRTFDNRHLELDGVAATFGAPELLIFASRHAGNTGPLLTAHATGNFGPAEYGGRDGSLARAAPNALSAVRRALKTYAPQGYDVGIECTHHGPSTVGCPSLFVEVGSDETQWRDSTAARAAARAILDLRAVAAHGERAIVGFGGGHYAPRFDRVLADTDWGVGHIAADWAIEAMGDPHEARAVIASTFQMSGAEFALLDGSHPDIESVIEELGFTCLSETFLRETVGVSLALVKRLEHALRPIDSGLRIGAAAKEHDGAFITEELPKEMLETVNGIDREAVVELLERHTIAYETTENGTLAVGAIAIAESGVYSDLLDAFVVILESKYDSVTRRASEIVARREVFDPALARERGVAPGPAFGQLANGIPVDVDGERIDPSDVQRAHEQRFRV